MILEALIEYRLCLCVLGGWGFRLRGLCPCCKIHRGDYVHVVKIMGGIMSMFQNSWRGGLCPRIQILAGGGGGCPGGKLSYTEALRSQTF